MKTDRVEGKRKPDQGQVVDREGELKRDDSDSTKGQLLEPRASKLQAAYGVSRDQTKKDVDGFCKSL